MELKDKFIAFLDILGFKGFVERAGSESGPAIGDLLAAARVLEQQDYRGRIHERGALLCPGAPHSASDLGYEVTQISDCAVISAEVSPAGLINLVSHCWGAVYFLLLDGYMCRGYITRGPIFHTDRQFIGSGYQRALEREGQVAAFKRTADDRGTPFVEVDPDVVDYGLDTGDPCVDKMFRRLVFDADGTHVLFPFSRLSHSFIVAGGPLPFVAAEEKAANEDIREAIRRTRDRVRALVDLHNPSALKKADHYLAALDRQLEICDRTDEIIERFRRDPDA